MSVMYSTIKSVMICGKLLFRLTADWWPDQHFFQLTHNCDWLKAYYSRQNPPFAELVLWLHNESGISCK